MKNYQDDAIWSKAKAQVKELSGELDLIIAISCYYELGGKNIFVYVVTDNGLSMITDMIYEDQVMLISQDKIMYKDDYESVFKARKVMHYSDHPKIVSVKLDKECQILIGETDMDVLMEGGN